MPFATPVTRPVVTPTVARERSLLLQVPPATPSLSCVVAPAHTVSVPVIAVAAGLTVTSIDVLQLPIEYVIVVVPPVVALTKPLAGFTVATELVLLLHTPPDTASVSWLVKPAHMVVLPLIATGDVFTVTTVVVVQPVGKV